MYQVIRQVSVYAVPAIILFICFFGLFKGVNVFDAFIDGAKDGLQTVIKIMPALVGLLGAVAVFKSSGGLEFFSYLLNPIARFMRVSPEVLPLALIRPVSGSASLAYLSEILKQFGTDTYIGMTACVIMGTTETIFYTVAVYLGAINIKNSKYVIPLALLIDLIGYVIASYICRMFFA